MSLLPPDRGQQIPSQVLHAPGQPNAYPLPSPGHPNPPGHYPGPYYPPHRPGPYYPGPRPYVLPPYLPSVGFGAYSYPISYFDPFGFPRTVVVTYRGGRILKRRLLRRGIYYPQYLVSRDTCNHSLIPSCGDCQGRYPPGHAPDGQCLQTCTYATSCANEYHISGSIIVGLRQRYPWLRL